MGLEVISKLFKNPYFNTVFSFILGLGLIIIARPVCKGSKCFKEKAPKPAEWNGQIYQFGASCHKYSTVIVDCPQEGYIESFDSSPPPPSIELNGPSPVARKPAIYDGVA